MYRYLWVFFLTVYTNSLVYSQDSTQIEVLDFVKVQATSAKAIVTKSLAEPLKFIQPAQVVGVFNTIPGVRMEQRSPGSYRMNIRGSSQRAPFGIRNVKFYLNGIPFTEPGGNTYLNQLNLNTISSVQIHKGPNRSVFGAGIGGVVSLNTIQPTHNAVSVGAGVGSFGTWNSQISFENLTEQSSHYLFFSKEASNGYREYSAMERTNLFYNPSLKYKNAKFSATILYSDLWYQTPGGLTLAQYESDRKTARPAAGAFPSASGANASIDQKNYLIGLTYEQKINDRWKSFATIYVSKLNLSNPTFRNYETRNEPHQGLRIGTTALYDFGTINAGFEYQQGNYTVKTFTNNQGEKGTLQTNDQVKNKTGFGYLNLNIPLNKWTLEAGYSANFIQTAIHRINEVDLSYQSPTPLVHLPKLMVKYLFGYSTTLTATIAKGYSPPSSSEVLPSNSIINTHLHAETGMNYELEFSSPLFKIIDGHSSFHLTGYIQQSKNTIVQRRDLSNADYYVNAGSTNQKGIESSFFIMKKIKLNHQIDISANLNYTDYKFKEYIILDQDYSNHRMPGNMRWNTYLQLAYQYKQWGKWMISHSYNDKMYLNDANIFTSEPYRILSMDYVKDFNLTQNKKHQLKTRFSVDNLLNEQYSLGFDFNAAANRFYNAAPGLQYFINIGYRYQF